MGKPKTRTTSRRSGMRRSHMVQKLARRVNANSPVRVGVVKTKTESDSKSKA